LGPVRATHDSIVLTHAHGLSPHPFVVQCSLMHKSYHTPLWYSAQSCTWPVTSLHCGAVLTHAHGLAPHSISVQCSIMHMACHPTPLQYSAHSCSWPVTPLHCSTVFTHAHGLSPHSIALQCSIIGLRSLYYTYIRRICLYGVYNTFMRCIQYVYRVQIYIYTV
jgi:hypothetical protein